ncbi:MAG: 2-hydroxyacyl-CoA dehydratase, partial [Candidatus Hydrogenedentes bacterium]|nr:2-hydroxyacyl-CoA dehydratase [Candidatus Hydrogenedentota bacterium]
EAVRRDKADGVIFLLTNFCDPVAFDFVPLKKSLEEADIPALSLSVEQHREPPEQLRTRVEAFVEMLQEDGV